MYFATNEDLIKNGINLDIFSYHDLSPDLVQIYSKYEEQFKKLLCDYAEAHNLKKCYFFIKNQITCNALAQHRNGFNIIGITNGYPILMERKYDNKFFNAILSIVFVNDGPISNAYAELHMDPNFHLHGFMLNCSIMFTFFHEFRHILQFNSFKSNNNIIYSENMEKGCFNLTKHAREFDTDRIAAFEVIKHTFRAYRNLKNRSNDKLKCLFLLALSSIVITKNLFYFNAMNRIECVRDLPTQAFYTEEHSHPHPLVRTVNIFSYFVDCVKDDFPKLGMEPQETLNNVLGINKIYFHSFTGNANAMNPFLEELRTHLDEIHSYNNKLYDAAINDQAIKNLLDRSNTKVDE